MMLHLACSHILATLQEDHADWQTAAFPALPRQGDDHRWPPGRACEDVLIPCHQDLLSGVQLEDHVRDVRGEINKEMKKAVRLAYGGRVAPKDSEVTSVPSRTARWPRVSSQAHPFHVVSELWLLTRQSARAMSALTQV